MGNVHMNPCRPSKGYGTIQVDPQFLGASFLSLLPAFHVHEQMYVALFLVKGTGKWKWDYIVLLLFIVSLLLSAV